MTLDLFPPFCWPVWGGIFIQEVTFAEVPVMECCHPSGQVVASLEISGVRVQVYKGADQATLQALLQAAKSC